MANVAEVLKSEIVRLARKEVKAMIEPMRKHIATQRHEIAAIKRDRTEMQREIARLAKNASADGKGGKAERSVGGGVGGNEGVEKVRYSPRTLIALRSRHGLSANDMGALVGIGGQSIYNWEQEKTRPREEHIRVISALRKLSKKDMAARLEAVKQAG